MGFFRDFKEDVVSNEEEAQSEKDSAAMEETVEIAESKEEETMSDFEDANVDKDLLNQIFGEGEIEETGETVSEEESEEKSEPVQEELPDFILPKEEESEEEKKEDENTSSEEPSFEEEIDLDAVLQEAEKERTGEQKDTARNAEVDPDTTVITKGTTINGGISSDGSLEIMGSISGDVECKGKLSVYGQISGNVTAADIVIDTKRLEGNIECDGYVEVAVGTVVIGDITGTSASIAGAVKGNIDVNGPVTIDTTAIVKGSIKAKSIQVNNGAVVDGYCSLNYAGVDLEDFFTEK